MTNIIQLFHLLVVALAGWINHHQQAVFDYLMEENHVLKEQLEGQRLRFTDDQRRRLAAKAKVLGRRLLDEIETLVTPDTLLAWHRKLISEKWTYPRKGPGRPRIAQEITELVIRMAMENVSWGYDRIQGALANLGHIIAPNTVKNILKMNVWRMILFSERSLRRVLNEYIVHYHAERNHQGLGNRLLDPTHEAGSMDDPIQLRERLGGILNFYYREAA